MNEDCRNCEKDVWKCSTTCGNGKIEKWEDCENCKEDVKMCIKTTCWDGKIDKESWEECDNWENNGKDNKCTKMCTIYDPSKPKCGNGEIDNDVEEDCESCAVDLWEKCVWKWEKQEPTTCGNGKIDEWENCQNCPEDVWECTAYCGNGIVEEAEDCRNCEKDVWKCSATCGNGKVDDWEDKDNCWKDVKDPKSETCWNGKVEPELWEECDSWKDKDWKEVKCMKMCKIYNPEKPKCGNWDIDNDEKEDCQKCAIDLWEKCVAEWDKEEPDTCWNKKVDEWEDCRNCEKDVWKCSATCGNGKVDDWEDKDNCWKDVKDPKSETCWNGKVEPELWEECDSWKDKDWKEVKCMKMCKIYNPEKPKCGNWDIDNDEKEDCQKCAIDLWEKCVAEWKIKTCGNGEIDKWEECDFNDEEKRWWWTDWCSLSCHKIDIDNGVCNTEYDWKYFKVLLNSKKLCSKWNLKNFSFNVNNLRWSWICEKTSGSHVNCSAEKSVCWDWIIDDSESCPECSKDLKDICIVDGCKCEECSEKLKDSCVAPYVPDPDISECKCEECPEKLKDSCVKPVIPVPECKCEECPEWSVCVGPYFPPDDIINPDIPSDTEPEDDTWHVESNDCNTCPCEYVDFSTELTKWDTVRAKLWDKALFVFYRYSNSVAIESFLDLD